MILDHNNHTKKKLQNPRAAEKQRCFLTAYFHTTLTIPAVYRMYTVQKSSVSREHLDNTLSKCATELTVIHMLRLREKCISEEKINKYLIPSSPIPKISSDKSFKVLTLLSQIIVQHTIRQTLQRQKM